MKKLLVGTMVLMLTVIGGRAAQAQETGKVGLVMTSGSSVGLTIQAGDRVAIRPTLSWSRATVTPGLADGERVTTLVSPGASLLIFLKSWDATRFYVSPQWTYSRATSDEAGVGESRTTGHLFSGMLGAQHALGSRFAVFAELGLSRSSSDSDALGGFSTNKATVWSSRSLVGGVLFF